MDSQSKTCLSCQEPIQDNSSISLKNKKDSLDVLAHKTCFRCIECNLDLNNEDNATAADFRYTDGKNFFCAEHYTARFGPECVGCKNKIVYGEQAFNLNGIVLHKECLVCSVCNVTIVKGENYSLDTVTSTFTCEAHAPTPTPGAAVTPTPASPAEVIKNNHGSDLEDEAEEKNNNSEDSKNKKRTPRTKFTEAQTKLLLEMYLGNPRPTRAMREYLAKETGLPVRCIQIWFQNKRSKEKRQHAKRFMASNSIVSWNYNYGNPTPVSQQTVFHPALHNQTPTGYYPPSPPTEFQNPSMTSGLPMEINDDATCSQFVASQQPPSFETAMASSYPSPPWEQME